MTNWNDRAKVTHRQVFGPLGQPWGWEPIPTGPEAGTSERTADHTHGCREHGCDGDFTRCELDNETCLRYGSLNFGGLCDYHEDEWNKPLAQDGTYIPGEFLHTMGSD